MDGIPAEELTRETFRNLSDWQITLFYLIAAVAMAVFLWGAARKVGKVRRGQAHQLEHSWRRAWGALRLVAGNLTVGRRHLALGTLHMAVMWGFIVLFIGTAILTVEDHTPAHFWYGSFYLWYSLALDVFGVLFLVGLTALAVRRGVRPRELSEARPPGLGDSPVRRKRLEVENWVFLGLLLASGVTGFLVEGLRMLVDQPGWEKAWSPVGWATAGALRALGFTPSGAELAYASSWWLHAVLALGFVGILPFTKARHVVIDAANLYASHAAAGERPGYVALPPVPEEQVRAGYPVITDFTWKHLLDHDACIRCGRCEVSCPATAAGRPLSPKQLILDLGQHADLALEPRWPPWRATADGNAGGTATRVVPGGVVDGETLWACTTCGACVEVCPVGIDQLGQIVQLRRALVEEGAVERHVQAALMSVFEQGNAFEEAASKRAQWSEGLEVTIRDARSEEVDVLWYVGDLMSFDRRAQQAAQALARVLARAGIDFGILYEGERNDGNDVRRIGEEGLFEMVARDNIEALRTCRFDRLLTADPHALNTFRNEYPELDGEWPTVHHSELLAEILASGSLPVARMTGTRATYHDPCFLARYNGVVDAPRRVLAALGIDLAEMPRCGAETFCCGAGGGGFFRDFPDESARPSELRIREAMALEPPPELFVVACPMDLVMYEDAVKTSGAQGRLRVVELSELVLEHLERTTEDRAESNRR